MDSNDAHAIRAQARIGQVLRDKWRIDKLLGVGGMATVFAATHCNNGKRVAVKILHPELSVAQDVRTRFLREGYVANKVAHASIVSVLDDDVAEDGAVFLVMELLEGETVETLRERSGGFLPVTQVLQICDQLLDVLAAAHSAGIVHRDIKPENLFLTRENVLKVLDFGIARLRELSSAKMTATGTGAMGTPAFMPPEQARGRSELVSARSDIWSVGATMFTIASGRLVHDAETVNELLLAAMTKPPPPFLSVLPMFPPGIAAVIDRALAFEQEQRWADARGMQAALRQAALGIGVILQDRNTISGLYPAAQIGLAALGGGRGSMPSFPEGITPWPALQRPPSMPMAPPSPMMIPAPAQSAPEPFRPSSVTAPLPAAAVLAARQAAVATAPAVTMGAGASMPAPGRARGRAKWALAGVGLLVLLGSFAVWMAFRRGPAPASPVEPAHSATMLEPSGALPEPPAVEPSALPSGAALPRSPEEPASPSASASPSSSPVKPAAPASKAPPISSASKKKYEKDLLNRRN